MSNHEHKRTMRRQDRRRQSQMHCRRQPIYTLEDIAELTLPCAVATNHKLCKLSVGLAVLSGIPFMFPGVLSFPGFIAATMETAALSIMPSVVRAGYLNGLSWSGELNQQQAGRILSAAEKEIKGIPMLAWWALVPATLALTSWFQQSITPQKGHLNAQPKPAVARVIPLRPTL